MKLGSSTPEPVAPTEPAPVDNPPANDSFGGETPSSDEKPFDAEPFDAGVDADEESDPKKFIEQLTGKLGQSLRKYNEQQGQPDFELEKFAINSLLSATHTSKMDAEDQKDIISKVKSAGQGDEDIAPEGDEPSDDLSDEEPMPTPEAEPSDEEGLEEFHVYENTDNLFVNPKKNNMFQEGSNDILDEMKPCWKGYKQIGMKVKNGKDVPNCVPVNENMGETNNYMFWQNLKTIHHASGELLEMDQAKVDEMIANGHAWVVDHIATSSDDIEEVYHFFEANIDDSIGSFNGETEGGYNDEYGSVQNVTMNESEYQGKIVKLGKPMKGDVKKFKVFVKNKSGKVVKVNFGDPNMEIKRDDPERKKSFRARHKCSEAKDRTTPKYWSCKMWSSTPVSKIVEKDLSESKKSSIFDKSYLKMKMSETFNQEDVINQQVTEPTPVITPTKPAEQPVKQPSRKNKPFLPMPSVQPEPKANIKKDL